MTDLRSAARNSAELVRKFKNDKVAGASETASGDDLDTQPMIEVYRGDDPVIVAMLMEGGSDNILSLARALILGFDADKCVITTESFHATRQTNPLTNRRWERGEMQELARKHDGVAKGWVTEGANTMAVNSAGDVVLIAQNFRVYQTQASSGWKIEWLEETVFDPSEEPADPSKAPAGVEGRMPEMLREFMNEPALGHMISQSGMTPADFGITDPEAARAHMDCAAVKMIYEAQICPAALMLHAQPGSVREEIIQRSLGHLSERLGEEE